MTEETDDSETRRIGTLKDVFFKDQYTVERIENAMGEYQIEAANGHLDRSTIQRIELMGYELRSIHSHTSNGDEYDSDTRLTVYVDDERGKR